MDWGKLTINWLLGWVPDIFIAWAFAKLTDDSWQAFWIAFIGIQALYFALWLKRTLWVLLLFYVFNRRGMADVQEQFFRNNNFPRPEMWVGDLDDYSQQILMDETADTKMKITASHVRGSLDGLKLAGNFMQNFMALSASKLALKRYALYAPEPDEPTFQE